MRRPEELNSLLRRAEYQSDQARLQWSQAQQQRDQARARLAELQAFAQEYETRARSVTSAAALLNHRRFQDKLSLAIRQQAALCEQAQTSEQAYLTRWRGRQQELKALETMQQKREQLWQLDQARWQQRQLDELAGQRHGRRQEGLS